MMMAIRFLRTPVILSVAAPTAKLQKHKLPTGLVPLKCSLVMTTMVSYYGGLHFPISYSGLSIVNSVLHDHIAMTPLVKALSLVVLQSVELFGTVLLIESNFKGAISFRKQLANNRGCWLVISAAAFAAVIFVLVVLPSGQIGTSDDALKEIILGGGILGLCATVGVSSVVTPLLEEYVYRGFLLPALAEYMSLGSAIGLSSLLFTFSHFSYLNSVPACALVFFLGSIFATAYAWTGDLAVPFALHSFYNLTILLLEALR